MLNRRSQVVLICVAILAFSSGALGKHREPSGLFLMERDGKNGFIDRAGTVVMEPQFDYANEFYEGLACVKIGDNWSYIDVAGRKVIEFKQKIDHAHDFSEGLAYITIGGKTGYIDKTGTMVIEPRFDVAFDFSEGLASISISDRWGFIDRTG